MDITNQITSANSGGGLQVNATDQRYLPVVGGIFYFVNYNAERKMYIAAVELMDSRYPEQQCIENK